MDWLQALGPSLLIVIGGIISWFLKSRIEELRAIEEKLREERRKIYGQILDPFIRLLSDLKGQGSSNALKQISSYEYRKTAFDLNLFGSDDVVQAYNNLWKYTYEAEKTDCKDPKEMMSLLGNLLLEIRKSLGNKNTMLTEIDMIRWMIKDIDNL
ncbi:hypothetical protein [Aminivibrio pyruvatiphilus]|uniref:hypothetical protein n=1 Tax=Aminivibrio pyruvatiphilus TaxID=1005740 RepID=UPI001062D3EB|nr:hypothetical protein [Aminivibrio pyruvatiphilus]